MKKKYAKDYTLQELMVVVASRELRDREIVFVGIGIPQLAVVLAQRTHAPNLVLIYESGTIAAKPMRMPLSIGDPTLQVEPLAFTTSLKPSLIFSNESLLTWASLEALK